MYQTVEFIANIVAILGFPLSVFLVVKEIRSSNKSINNLADSIKNQQIINTDKIENVHIHNRDIKQYDKQ